MANGVSHRIIYDKDTGDRISLATDLKDVSGTDKLLTNDDVTLKTVQITSLGLSVIECYWSQTYLLTIDGTNFLFMAASFTVNKKMLTADWGVPEKKLMDLPEGMTSNPLQFQPLVGRIAGDASTLGLNFRVFGEKGNMIYFEGVESGSKVNPNDLPDRVSIELSGRVVGF
ncbi:hypothetical protein M8332_06925 (plasmid) [Fructilactobacillus ixorae]|uniref:Uncharacterized protein n=1 Tax=Fructilactobacillus ixorae TaxID=1750535 RepID=A0ABY5C5H0_9LACO|nr:hypothetical protein [Fructilactobacillus ixorae]USS94014.1 hypothetical protein M8332_06925 [Fructilactobacillus ixorae]